jgi:hypothetical protein
MQAGSPDRVNCRLAAILAAGVVGYSQLMCAAEGSSACASRRRSRSDEVIE